MRAVCLNKNGLEVDCNYPQPKPNESESLIRVLLAGICSTDLELVKGYYEYQGVLGHEFVGIVEQSSEPGWIGKRVVSSINFADANSPEFAEFGLEHHPRRTVLGIVARDGAMADYVVVPTQNLFEIPPTVSDREAVFVEPLAAAIRIAEQIQLRPTHRVAVLGPGRLGLLVAQVLMLRGAEVTVFGRSQSSLELPQQLGLSTALTEDAEDSSFHLVAECTGSPQGLVEAIRMARPCGTLVLKSTYAGQASINFTKVVVDEIKIVGSRCGPFAPAIRLLERRQVEVNSLIDGIYGIEQARQAFDRAAQSGASERFC
ncbi:MAG: alcohol dehydrogenase catalytic domain-containing protein [Pirellulales bacterium]